MDVHDEQDCNTTLELGLNQYYNRPNKESTKSSVQNEKEIIKEEYDYSNYDKSCSRKKLKLTRDQTTFLEDTFRQHTTLNTAQKHALAERLNLETRQVEVWFQNRRARTKLKQTERECNFLKRNCERLSEENRRLKRELLDLSSGMKVQLSPPQAAAAPNTGVILSYSEGGEV